jgi:hypothetical protein
MDCEVASAAERDERKNWNTVGIESGGHPHFGEGGPSTRTFTFCWTKGSDAANPFGGKRRKDPDSGGTHLANLAIHTAVQPQTALGQ